MTKNRVTAYLVVVNDRYTVATYETRRQANRHVRTLGAIIEVEGSKYPVNTVEIVKQTFTTVASFSPRQTTVFVADGLDSDLTEVEA